MAEESSPATGNRQRSQSGRGVVEPRPLDVDGVGTAVVGSIAWALALIATVVYYDTLREQGRDWWLWTCLAGLGLGLIGFEYCRRRRTRERLRADRAAGGPTGRRARRSEDSAAE